MLSNTGSIFALDLIMDGSFYLAHKPSYFLSISIIELREHAEVLSMNFYCYLVLASHTKEYKIED
jgi:hypothetical protein